MSQMALPLAWPAAPANDAFLVTASNAHAAQLLRSWSDWPVRTAILTGPRRSGRSLLARIFAANSNGRIIDNAERVAEAQLFHAWNAAQHDGTPLVIVADAAPPAWSIQLPDLRSRLAASPHAAIEAPDDELMHLLLDHHCAGRGLDARGDLIDWIVAHIERTHLALERVVDALDQQAMEQHRRLTIPLARTTLIQSGMMPAKPETA